MLSLDPAQMSWLRVVGSAYDIAGALMLARGLIFVSPGAMAQQAFGFSGGVDYSLLKLFSERKYDGYFGGALLAAGFTLQAAASADERSAFFLLPSSWSWCCWWPAA